MTPPGARARAGAGLTAFVAIGMGGRAPLALLIVGGSAVLQARMAWDDIVLLADSEFVSAYGARMGGQTYTYSLHDRLTIGDQLIGDAQLLEVVRANARPIELAPGRG